MMNAKSENRKAFPKFVRMMVLALLCGGAVGLVVGLSKVFGLDVDGIAGGLGRLLRVCAPWGPLVCMALFGGGMLLLYRSAAREAALESGDETEESLDAENHLSWALLLSSMQLLAALFFFAAAVHYELPGMLYHVALLLASCGMVIFEQQKIVDLTKRMNPEKRGSVYDAKFQTKWLESCDESECQQIGQAAYHAFQVTSNLCLWLWVALTVLNMVFGFGLMPSFVVLVVLGVMQGSYALECIRISKQGKQSYLAKKDFS